MARFDHGGGCACGLNRYCDCGSDQKSMKEGFAARAAVKTRRVATPAPARPDLDALIEAARKLPPMTPEQIEKQRRSWVVGETMLAHPEMSRERAEQLYDEVILGKKPVEGGHAEEHGDSGGQSKTDGAVVEPGEPARHRELRDEDDWPVEGHRW